MRFKFEDTWKHTQLENVVNIISGISPTGLIDKEGVIPYYKVDQLNNCNVYLIDTSYKVNENNKIITEESIVFPKRGAAILTNKIIIAHKNFMIDTNLMSLQLKRNRISCILAVSCAYLTLFFFDTTHTIF